MKPFEDRVSSEHRDRVLQSVEGELAKLQPRSGRRLLFGQAAAAFGAIVIGVFIFNKKREIEPDPHLLADLDLIQDLDLWQNLQLLEDASELDKES